MTSSELARKAVHIAFGFAALSLAWLTTLEAAIVAACAFLFNWKILPHAGGKSISRDRRGTDRGILLYPLAVFALILSFPGRPEIAAACWGIIAFGDGLATVAGKLFPIVPLRWNRAKSLGGFLTFVIAGTAAAFLLWSYVRPSNVGWLIVVTSLATLGAAIAESLELGIDDNITVPAASALAFVYLLSFDAFAVLLPAVSDRYALLANLVLAVVGWIAKSVSASGMIGGFLLGSLLVLFGGWELYTLLIVFFVLGSGTTKLGYGKKAERGLAQESGGRRGFTHAWSNVGVATLLAIAAAFSSRAELLWIAAAASLATATADTVASEIGQLLGRRAFLPDSLRRVERGTEGAISIEGTAAGAIGAIILAAVAAWAFGHRFGFASFAAAKVFAVIAVAAIAGSYIESLAGSYNRRSGAGIPNGALNFFNTLVGALLAVAGVSWP